MRAADIGGETAVLNQVGEEGGGPVIHAHWGAGGAVVSTGVVCVCGIRSADS